jgi:hypothetical protein
MDVYITDGESRAVLVGSVESEGKQIVWQGNDTGEFITTFDNWGKIHLSIRLPEKILHHKNLVFKTYLWNRDSANLCIDNLRIQIHNGNPVLYGLFEKI